MEWRSLCWWLVSNLDTSRWILHPRSDGWLASNLLVPSASTTVPVFPHYQSSLAALMVGRLSQIFCDISSWPWMTATQPAPDGLVPEPFRKHDKISPCVKLPDHSTRHCWPNSDSFQRCWRFRRAWGRLVLDCPFHCCAERYRSNDPSHALRLDSYHLRWPVLHWDPASWNLLPRVRDISHL